MPNDITLRDVQESDLPVLFEHQNDPVAWHMAAFSSRQRDDFMLHWAKIIADPALVARAILLDGQLVGNLSCFERDGLREIGYWIAREHWGKGIASRSLAMFLREVKERPLYAFVVADNIGSVRVLEKNGFRVLRREKAYLAARGEELDDIVMVLDREE